MVKICQEGINILIFYIFKYGAEYKSGGKQHFIVRGETRFTGNIQVNENDTLVPHQF